MNGAEIFEISKVPVVIRLSHNPESGITGNGIDVRINGTAGIVDQVVHGVLHEEMVCKDRINDSSTHVQVSHPAATVPLGSVPDIVLHAQVRRVSPYSPDAVEQGIKDSKAPSYLTG